MATLSDLPDTMVNARRVGISLLLGLIFLMVAMLQAGAAQTDSDPLGTTQRGLRLGVVAGSEIESSVAGGVAAGDPVSRAIDVLQSVVVRFNAERRRHGRGPMRAVDVHQALVEGALPGGSGPGGPAGRALGLLEKQLGRQGQGLPPGLARKDG